MNLPIQLMSVAEKIQAMEELWNSLQVAAVDARIPEWHGRILNERRERVERGESTFSSLDEVKDRLRKLGT